MANFFSLLGLLPIICVIVIVYLPGPSGAILISNAISEMRVSGQLGCTLTGNPTPVLPIQPLVGANVTASCGLAGTIHLGEVTTDADGTFNIVYRVPSGVIFETTTCTVRATLLHILTCALLAPSRVLASTITLIDFNGNDGAVIASFRASAFTVVS